MKRLGTMCLLLSCLTVILLGCTPKFVKRREVEDKLVRLSKVYPTPKASDLFEKFPNGFEIYYQKGDFIKNKKLTNHIFKMTGIPETKEIKGVYTKKEIYSTKEEISETPVIYTDSEGFQATDGQDLDPFVKDIRFLFTEISFDKSYLNELNLDLLTENPASGDYSISYQNVENTTINSHLGLPSNSQVRLEIYSSFRHERENKYFSAVSAEKGIEIFFSETITEK